MFSWNFAKSAEEMFSRLAVKRVCKFLLKKKLGDFILGDIDLDQLDVQLRDGTIRLSDLGLNLDFINTKLGEATSVIIKEGSIGSLLVQLPWKSKTCELEIDELELLLAPRPKKDQRGGNKLYEDDENCSPHDQRKPNRNAFEHTPIPAPGDVHEGVRTIAKLVKCLLTSFHVRIKKLIVAFEPYIEVEETSHCETLVLRISELECGTCVSEDTNLHGDHEVESCLGISRLTNYVNFHGGILELLQMDDFEDRGSLSSVSGKAFSDLLSSYNPSNFTTPILSGKESGFSGKLTLSIPWKNGSLDITTVDADVSIEPLELKLRPSILKWLLLSWDTIKNIDGDNGEQYVDSIYLNAKSQWQSSVHESDGVGNSITIGGSSSATLTSEKQTSEALLPESHIISDWVPFYVNKKENDLSGRGIDLGASMNQFFECFDGMRNSQSALGSSGMWNWTSSVFTAITAASNLASGALHVPSEQQHVKTNLKATIVGISITILFPEEEKSHLCFPDNDGSVKIDSYISHLGANCSDMLFILQVCPEELKFEGKVKYIEIANYINRESGLGLGVSKLNPSIEQLQAEVLGSLPKDILCSDIFPNESAQSSAVDCPTIQGHDTVEVVLLKTSGILSCQITLCWTKSDGLIGPRSFSLELPPFIFWLDFCLVKKLLDLVKDVTAAVEVNDQKRNRLSEISNAKHSSHNGDIDEGCGPFLTTLSVTAKLQGCVTITSARVLLCFPLDSHLLWNQFIAFDFSSVPATNKVMIQDPSSISPARLRKMVSSSVTNMLQLNFGNVDAHMVTSASGDICEITCGVQRPVFSARKFFSITNNAKAPPVSLSWHDCPTTGPWIAKKAKSLATSEEPWSRIKFANKGYEFASATAMNVLDDSSAQIREEIILSSALFLHVCLSAVIVSLDSSDYKTLDGLLKQLTGLSSGTHEQISVGEGSSAFQTSVQVECDALEFLLCPDIKENIGNSLQTELPGSWDHLKLSVWKFELLSVSNIGGQSGANFLWLSHGEGNLWGSITEVPGREFLLISCSNSAMKRGDGGGSNALSYKLAGTDIVHLWEPENLHSFTSVTIRCGTIHAVGGRLDWLETVTNFFIVPPGTDGVSDSSSGKGDSNPLSKASFVLNLVDIALSYEPYLSDLVTSDVLECNVNSPNKKVETSEPHVACLLAASSFNLLNTTGPHSNNEEYKIRVQDLGLLICQVSSPRTLDGGVCDSKNLLRMGYIKVARESLVEVTLRTNSKDGLVWDVECSRSHIFVETCHDTTSALIRLAAQLQQLFAPELEESVVHLQTRWNDFQQSHERTDPCEEPISPVSQLSISSADMNSKSESISLMDEICHNTFKLDGNLADGTNSSESQVHFAIDESFFGEPFKSSIENSENSSKGICFSGSSSPATGMASSKNSLSGKHFLPEVIEGYCLSETCPRVKLPAETDASSEILEQRSNSGGKQDIEKKDSWWYGDIPLNILENHISDVCEEDNPKQFVVEELLSIDGRSPMNSAMVVGRALLKDINIRWRMYGGSDWYHTVTSGHNSKEVRGRDVTSCMEIVLSGLNLQYDVFPLGGVPASKLYVSVHDFYLYDRSKDAPWKLALGYYHSKAHPRETYAKAFKLELEAVRPDANTPLEEYRLGISFLPLVLHLHQSQIDFLIGFFGMRSSEVDHSACQYQDSSTSTSLPTKNVKNSRYAIAEEALLPYFQKFDIWPTIIHVDYQPHHVDLPALGGGNFVELVNLVPWKGVELQLKHVHATGVYGWSSVCGTVIGEWLEDISHNQIRKVLKGIPTIHSLVAVLNAVAKLVSLPYENYRKDQRVVKGMQRGTIAFLRSISLEAIGLGVHLAAGAHEILLKTEYILERIQPSVRPVQRRKKSSARSNQPKNAQQGIQQAYEIISDGLGKSASALVRNPLKKYERGAGAASALATAVRAVPAATIAPVSACASAIHSTLLGVRNSLDPERKKASMEKYMGPATPQSRFNDAEE